MLEWDPGWLISDKWCQSSVEVKTLILYRTIGGKEIHFIQTNNFSKGHCVELAFVDLLLHDISNLYIFLFFYTDAYILDLKITQPQILYSSRGHLRSKHILLAFS